jgi:hypothetical protein
VESIYLVSQSDAALDYLKRLLQNVLGDGLGIADSRRSDEEYERAGYQFLLGEKRIGQAQDIPPAGGTVILLVEEPTVGAFLAYEEDLRGNQANHSLEHLQNWLARDAVAKVDLWNRFGPASEKSALIVRREDLAASPRKALEGVLAVMGVAALESDIASALYAAEQAGIAPQPALTAIEAEAHFARPAFLEFMNVLVRDAAYMGYQPWHAGKVAPGAVATLYDACRAAAEKDYERVAALLTPFVGTHAVDAPVRAMLGEAMMETGRELEGRRAMEIVLRMQPDYLDGYTLLAKHAYDLGLNVEGRGYLREAASRPGGDAHVRRFLHRVNPDARLEAEFPPPAEVVDRDSVERGFFWILGRSPETDAVIESHRLKDDETLRLALLRSDEFRALFEKTEADQVPPISPEQQKPVHRRDVLDALHWILGRPLASREEADDLLACGSAGECRLKLIRSDGFRELYRGFGAAP